MPQTDRFGLRPDLYPADRSFLAEQSRREARAMLLQVEGYDCATGERAERTRVRTVRTMAPEECAALAGALVAFLGTNL